MAAIQFSGGIFLPFELSVFDNTLACIYQGKEHRCSSIKYINFGSSKNQQKRQIQMISIRNLNPNPIQFRLHSLDVNTSKLGVNVTVRFKEPFPYYPSYVRESNGTIFVNLKAGHFINLTIIVQIIENLIPVEIPLILETAFQRISPIIKFSFQQGKLMVQPEIYNISQSDVLHKGLFKIYSTFQETYQIK